MISVFAVLIFSFVLIYWFRRTRLFVLLVLKTSLTEQKEDMSKIRARPAGNLKATAWIRNIRKQTQSCYKKTSALYLLLKFHALYYLELWCVAGCVRGSWVRRADMWRWEKRAFFLWIALTSNPWIRPALRKWSTGRPKACASHDAEQLGEKSSAVYSLLSNQMQFFKQKILSSFTRSGTESVRLQLTCNNHYFFHVQLICPLGLSGLLMKMHQTLDFWSFLLLIMLLTVSHSQSMWGYWYSDKRIRSLTPVMLTSMMMMILCDITWEATLISSFSLI